MGAKHIDNKPSSQNCRHCCERVQQWWPGYSLPESSLKLSSLNDMWLASQWLDQIHSDFRKTARRCKRIPKQPNTSLLYKQAVAAARFQVMHYFDLRVGIVDPTHIAILWIDQQAADAFRSKVVRRLSTVNTPIPSLTKLHHETVWLHAICFELDAWVLSN